MNREVVCFQAAPTIEGRKIAGILIPWGETATDRPIRFQRGSITWPEPFPLRAMHDGATELPLGLHGVNMELTDTAAALLVEATLPDTARADDVLALAGAGILTGLSGEVVLTDVDRTSSPATVKAARLVGVALVPTPALDSARLFEKDQARARRRRRRLIAGLGG